MTGSGRVVARAPRPVGIAPVGADQSPIRPMRADAVRNRERILHAAEEVFAREGLAVPVDVVAERAGVGVGTLYRHFPTKEALFEAIVMARIEELVEVAAPDAGDDPTDRFFAFLNRMADQMSLKHDLFDALAAAGMDVKSRCADQVEELEARLEALRRRAVEAGGIRDDVTTGQIIGLVVGTCLGADRPGMEAQSCHRMLHVVFDGLRARH